MPDRIHPAMIRGVPALLFAALGLLAAQSLAVVPGEARLGRFPAWEGRRLSVAVRNAGRGCAVVVRVMDSQEESQNEW